MLLFGKSCGCQNTCLLALAKAGVWDPEQAEQALVTTGLYEATGLALWLRTNSTAVMGPNRTDINWQSLQNFKEAWFSRKSLFKASVQRGAGTKRARVQASRLLWPCEMVCGIVNAATAQKPNFDASLPLLASGLFVLWAWFVAMYEAMQSKETWPLKIAMLCVTS